jgi:hypothetical protein
MTTAGRATLLHFSALDPSCRSSNRFPDRGFCSEWTSRGTQGNQDGMRITSLSGTGENQSFSPCQKKRGSSTNLPSSSGRLESASLLSRLWDQLLEAGAIDAQQRKEDAHSAGYSFIKEISENSGQAVFASSHVSIVGICDNGNQQRS